jgi:hypothetical protein
MGEKLKKKTKTPDRPPGTSPDPRPSACLLYLLSAASSLERAFRILSLSFRLVLYLKNLEIYFSRELHFSSFFSRFFVLCYPNLEKKNLEFFFSSFFGVNLAKFFCEVNLEFFLEIFISQVFFSVLYFYEISRFSVCRISRVFLSTKKSVILITMHM